jgi:hypothetical protein
LKTTSRDCLRRLVSPIEEGLLFHDFYCAEGIYVDQMVCDVVGDVDRARFEATLRQLVRMHEILRTLYVRDSGHLAAEIRISLVPELPFHDLSERHGAREAAMRRIAADAQAPFDPSQNLSRCALYRLGRHLHIFSWTYHHALADSWTLYLLQEHFCAIYRGLQEGPEIAQEPTPYSDYVRWIAKQDTAPVSRFWSEYLACQRRNNVRTDLKLDLRGERTSVRIELSAEARAYLEKVRREKRVTLNMAVLAMWGIFVLARQRTTTCLLGCTVFGRSLPVKGINTVAGVCANTVPVVINEAAVLETLLPQLQKHVLQASSRSFLSLGDMLATAGLSHRDMHSVVNFSIDRPDVATVLPFNITNIRYSQAANFDAYLDVEIGEAIIALTVHFDRGRRIFDEADDRRACEMIARAMAEHVHSTVHDIVDTLLLDGGAFDAAFDFTAGRMV